MRKILSLLTWLCLSILIAIPTEAAAIHRPANIENQLSEISNRLTSVESNWGRFQIGGDLTLRTDSSLSPQNLALYIPSQQLHLFLDAFVDQNLQFSLKLNQTGIWGESTGSPLQIDEAYVKLELANTADYFGRFRFVLGPLGLITDFSNVPLDGVAIQFAWDSFFATGLFTRLNISYDNNYNVTEVTDYLATRLGWTNQKAIIGLNIVPQGVASEKDFSIDFSYNTDTNKIAAEAGWRYFRGTGFNPGILASFGHQFSKTTFAQIKAALITQGFQPSCSSIFGKEWFTPNSTGAEVYLQNSFAGSYQLENRLLVTVPLQSLDLAMPIYRFRSSIAKYFSAYNQVQIGFEHRSNPAGSNQIFALWDLQF